MFIFTISITISMMSSSRIRKEKRVSSTYVMKTRVSGSRISTPALTI
jgi:hypothetical protein